MNNKQVQPEGNYFNKYDVNNPIYKYLLSSFFKAIENLLKKVEYNNALEVGCGEGYVTNYIFNLKPQTQIEGIDISEKVINEARDRFPLIQFEQGSILNIDRQADSYDLVVASEVLEHIENPEKALMEIFRVSKRYILISVPNEPIWRISNFLRGKYIRELGNTPGHIQHWTKRGITSLVENYGKVINVQNPFPWTILLCEKR